MKKILLTIVLTMVMCMFGITAYAAEEPLTLDIEDGSITITETGYIQDGITEIPYTGSYILTGSTTEDQMYDCITIEGIADGQTITLKDLEITSSGPYPLNVSGDIEVEATGTIHLTGISVAVSVNGKLTVTGDADIVLAGNYAYGIYGNGDINITCNSLEVNNLSKSSPAVCANLIANVTNDIIMTGGLGISGNADITSGGDVTITCHNSNAVTGALIADVDGNLTITGNSSTSSLISNGAELNVGGDVELINEVGQVISNGLEVNVGGNLTILGGGSGPAISTTSDTDIEVAGDFTIKGNTSSTLINISGDADIVVEGDFSVQGNTSAPLINVSGDADIVVEGDFTVQGNTNSPLIYIGYGDMNVSASSIDIENEGVGQAIVGTSGYTVNILATDGDINIKASTVYGGTISTIKSTLIALEGDITIVNEEDFFVVTNDLNAMAKNIYVSGANTSYSLAASNIVLVAEENIELTTNGGSLTLPNVTPSLTYGGSVSVNDGAGTLEIEIAESKIEYNGESQKPELTVLVDGTAIGSEDYIIEYYDESGASIDEFVELGIYKMVIRGANASWTLYGTFEIVVRDITDAVITVENDTFTYNGEEQSVVIESVVIDGITLSESDYQVSGDKATDAGEYELRVTAAEGSNFTGTATLRYVIEEVEDNSGDEPGNESGDEPGNEPGNEPGDEPGNKPGNESGNKPGNESGNDTGNNSGNNAGNNAGNNSGSNAGNNAGNNSGSNAGNNAGNNSGSNAGNNAGNNVGNNTENKAPNAGDNANLGIIMIISVVAMMCVVVSQKKKVNQN